MGVITKYVSILISFGILGFVQSCTVNNISKSPKLSVRVLKTNDTSADMEYEFIFVDIVGTSLTERESDLIDSLVCSLYYKRGGVKVNKGLYIAVVKETDMTRKIQDYKAGYGIMDPMSQSHIQLATYQWFAGGDFFKKSKRTESDYVDKFDIGCVKDEKLDSLAKKNSLPEWWGPVEK